MEPTAAPGVFSFASLTRTVLSAGRARRLSASASSAVSFSIGTAPAEVFFSEPRSAGLFLERYADLAAASTPSQACPAVRLYVAAEGGETLLWADPDSAWCWPHGPLEPDVVAFLADAALQHEFVRLTAAIAFHAAVVALDGSCAALAGTPSAGKTTAAVACARAGFRFYSDERCIVQSGRVVPFPRRVTLRPGGRAALLADEPTVDRFSALLESVKDRGDVAVRPSQLFGAEAIGGAALPLRCLFVIEGRRETPALEPMTALKAAPSLVLSLSSGESAVERLEYLLQALRGVEVYRLTLGSPAATAHAIKEVLVRAGSAVGR